MPQSKPLLLFDGECGVCRHIAHWVQSLAHSKSGEPTLLEKPIGDNPEALRLLNPALDIWEAYETIHILMPDGSMKLGGEAVAEVLRNLPQTKWLAQSFNIHVFGRRPFQALMNFAYAILADVRPLFGCESCGAGGAWMKPIRWMVKRRNLLFGKNLAPHFTPRAKRSSAVY